MNGCDILQDFAKKLMQNLNVSSATEKGKIHFKTRYQTHCMDETSNIYQIVLANCFVYPKGKYIHLC